MLQNFQNHSELPCWHPTLPSAASKHSRHPRFPRVSTSWMPKRFYEIRNSRRGVHSGTKWPQRRPSIASRQIHARETFQWLDTKFISHIFNFLIGTFGEPWIHFQMFLFFLSTPLIAQKLACTTSQCASVLISDLKWFDTQQNHLLDFKMPVNASKFKHRPYIKAKALLSVSAAAWPTATILHCKVVHPQTLVGDWVFATFQNIFICQLPIHLLFRISSWTVTSTVNSPKPFSHPHLLICTWTQCG